MEDRFRFRNWNRALKRYSTVDNPSMYAEFPEYNQVEQCTGLKDKNGTLIYEGDLIKWSDYDKYPHLVRVSWCDLLCCFAFINEDGKFIANHLEPFWNKDVEVVGNIHEREKIGDK